MAKTSKSPIRQITPSLLARYSDAVCVAPLGTHSPFVRVYLNSGVHSDQHCETLSGANAFARDIIENCPDLVLVPGTEAAVRRGQVDSVQVAGSCLVIALRRFRDPVRVWPRNSPLAALRDLHDAFDARDN